MNVLRLTDLKDQIKGRQEHSTLWAIGCWLRWLRDDIQNYMGYPRHWYQRATRGWSDRDSWSYYSVMAENIAGVCNFYLQHGTKSHPCLNINLEGASTEDSHGLYACMNGRVCGCTSKYDHDLVTIRDGMLILVRDDIDEMHPIGPDGHVHQNPLLNESLDLLREHFFTLWS